MKEVPSANLVRLENMVMSLMRIARVVELASTEILQWVPQNVLSVQLDGHRKLAAPSVNLARLEPSAASKVKPVSRAKLITIVKVKKKMPMVILQMKVQIQRLALTVRQAGRQKKVVQNVKRVALEHTATATAVNHAH